MGRRHRRWTETPSCRRETPVRHRPGRPCHDPPRHARRRTPTLPGTSKRPSVRDCGQYPPRPCHRQMNPGSPDLRRRSTRELADGRSGASSIPHRPTLRPKPRLNQRRARTIGCPDRLVAGTLVGIVEPVVLTRERDGMSHLAVRRKSSVRAAGRQIDGSALAIPAGPQTGAPPIVRV